MEQVNWPEALWRTLRLASSSWGRTARLSALLLCVTMAAIPLATLVILSKG